METVEHELLKGAQQSVIAAKYGGIEYSVFSWIDKVLPKVSNVAWSLARPMTMGMMRTGPQRAIAAGIAYTAIRNTYDTISGARAITGEQFWEYDPPERFVPPQLGAPDVKIALPAPNVKPLLPAPDVKPLLPAPDVKPEYDFLTFEVYEPYDSSILERKLLDGLEQKPDHPYMPPSTALVPTNSDIPTSFDTYNLNEPGFLELNSEILQERITRSRIAPETPYSPTGVFNIGETTRPSRTVPITTPGLGRLDQFNLNEFTRGAPGDPRPGGSITSMDDMCCTRAAAAAFGAAYLSYAMM